MKWNRELVSTAFLQDDQIAPYYSQRLLKTRYEVQLMKSMLLHRPKVIKLAEIYLIVNSHNPYLL